MTITDFTQGKRLRLNPSEQTAIMESVPTLENPYYRIDYLRKRMTHEAEPVGEREIDGRWAVGFRHTDNVVEEVIWADKQTGMPVRVEMTARLDETTNTPIQTTFVMSDFVFNEPVDPSLFSFEVPEGYQLQEGLVDPLETARHALESLRSPLLEGEQDLIKYLRLYAEVKGGQFPPDIRPEETTDEAPVSNPNDDPMELPLEDIVMELEDTLMKLADEMTTLEDDVTEPVDEVSLSPMMDCLWDYLSKLEDDQRQQTIETIAHAEVFVTLLGPENDWLYAGNGVRLGDTDTPIFRWRPNIGSEDYRVIYADLTVRDVPPDQLPDMK